MKDFQQTHPKLSFCIPTRNRSHRLASCLRTLAISKNKDFECVIIDNASTDDTSEVVKPFLVDGRFRYLRFDVHVSINAQFQRCVESSLGTWLSIIGDDDGLIPQSLDNLASLISNNALQLESVHAISWPQAIYRWPDFPGPEAGFLRLAPCSPNGMIRAITDSSVFFDFSDNNLKKIYNGPQIYHSLVRLETAKQILASHPNTTFILSPDISFACHFALCRLLSIRLPYPVSIAGYSASSTGGSNFNGMEQVRESFFRENESHLGVYREVFGEDFSVEPSSTPATEVSCIYAIACKVADSHIVQRPSVQSYITSELNNARKVSPRIRPLVGRFLSSFGQRNGFSIDVSAFDSVEPAASLGAARFDISRSGEERYYSCVLKMDPDLVEDIYGAARISQSLLGSFN